MRVLVGETQQGPPPRTGTALVVEISHVHLGISDHVYITRAYTEGALKDPGAAHLVSPVLH
jgi:hypothetical protein